MSVGATPSRSAVPPPRARAWRLWLFRLVAVVGIPALLLALVEGGLRVAGVGQPTGFLVPDEKPGYLRTNPAFTHLFMPAGFDLRPLNFRVAERKPTGALRVVVLGESAAQGVPEPRFAFAAQLRAQLRARHPGREVEVINTGIVAINSHVVRRIARDVARLEPDLFVIYLGNNEVVGPYSPGSAYLAQTPPGWVIRASVLVRSTYTGQLLGRVLGRLGGRDGPPRRWEGMAMFTEQSVRGDDPRLAAVYGNFEHNLRAILDTAEEAGAGIVLCTVVANLADSAPFLSLNRPDLTGAELDRWRSAFSRGRRDWLLGDGASARPHLEAARRADPTHAETHFLLGRIALEAGDLVTARRDLGAALEWDALRFRPASRINEVIRELARERPGRVQLVDAALELGSDAGSTGAPAGRELLFEHVHFDWPGNFALADRLARAIGTIRPAGTAAATDGLDSSGCARALGYTAHARLSVLLRIEALMAKPPFTNQVTYVEDRARMAREIARARARFVDPASRAEAGRVVGVALAADPDNPDLLRTAREIAIDEGRMEEALAHVRREAALRPPEFGLVAEEASLLARLGRVDESRARLEVASALGNAAEVAAAWADHYRRTGKLAEGRRHFDGAVAARPGDHQLRLLRGRLAAGAGDGAAAEADFRAALGLEPSGEDALEALVALLRESGREADVAEISLEVADAQPGNHANLLRAALAAEARGDEARSAGYLEAAGRAGPVNAAVELRLAQKLFRLGRPADSLEHLALARRLAAIEGDTETVAQVGRLITQLRPQVP